MVGAGVEMGLHAVAHRFDVSPGDDLVGEPVAASVLQVLLLAGGFLVGFGWIAGLILLWTSPSWTERQKLLGTLVLPGGLALLPILLVYGVGDSLAAWLRIVLAAALVTAPVLAAVYLWRAGYASR